MIPIPVNDFIEEQLQVWPEAAERFRNLASVERKPFKLGDLEGFFQFNPSRLVSTAAKTDSHSLSSRPCFLCRENRPNCQNKLQLVEGWDFLLNPFPIFPAHFTIAASSHVPQDVLPPECLIFADIYG